MRVVVGLGNPGRQYERTRHNMGFLVAEEFAGRHGLTLKEERKFKGRVARGLVGEEPVCLLLPTTYMNESGEAVRLLCDFYKVAPYEVLVISDDADLPFGELRFREKGSSGGHNGLKSIERALGTQEYPRLKIGIGREGGELVGHVLGKFNAAEEERLQEVLKAAEEFVTKTIEEKNEQN